MPEGVLTFSNKECLRVFRPSGSPASAGRFPRCGAGSPSPCPDGSPELSKKLPWRPELPKNARVVKQSTELPTKMLSKKTCLLVEQEDMFSCSTRRHVFLLNIFLATQSIVLTTLAFFGNSGRQGNFLTILGNHLDKGWGNRPHTGGTGRRLWGNRSAAPHEGIPY